ncbi:MAG: alpha/beta hydrolase [Bacteroidota bacterium]
MNTLHSLVYVAGLCLLICSACQSGTSKQVIDTTPKRILLDSTDNWFGHYHVLEPESGQIDGVIFLLAGLTQDQLSIFQESDLPQTAAAHNLLTVAFAGRTFLTADDRINPALNRVFEDVMERYQVSADQFVLGGFSAGGIIAMRYTELCVEKADQFPIQPAGLFMVDSPIDLFFMREMHQEFIRDSVSEIAVGEARFLERLYRGFYGTTPEETPEAFRDLSPFSMKTALGTNEQFLMEIPIRCYHDVDIMWRITERGQPARYQNYIPNAELINRLILAGHSDALLVQSYQTGYRANGDRHPHSWSVIDEQVCVEWIQSILP